MQEFKARVLGIEKYVDSEKIEFFIIKLEKNGLIFKPGQFAMLAMDGFMLRGNPSQMKWTSYSISSSPEQENLEFCIKIKDTEGFSSYLGHNIEKDGHVHVKGPFGKFGLNENATENIFIATGAGIAPFIGMIRYLAENKDKRPMKLFFGFRTSKQFLYKDELEELNRLENFSMFTIMSREGDNRGHVQKLLENYNFTKEEDVYLCGSKEMMDETKALLKEKGFSDEKIHIEVW